MYCEIIELPVSKLGYHRWIVLERRTRTKESTVCIITRIKETINPKTRK